MESDLVGLRCNVSSSQWFSFSSGKYFLSKKGLLYGNNFSRSDRDAWFLRSFTLRSDGCTTSGLSLKEFLVGIAVSIKWIPECLYGFSKQCAFHLRSLSIGLIVSWMMLTLNIHFKFGYYNFSHTNWQGPFLFLLSPSELCGWRQRWTKPRPLHTNASLPLIKEYCQFNLQRLVLAIAIQLITLRQAIIYFVVSVIGIVALLPSFFIHRTINLLISLNIESTSNHPYWCNG